MFLSIVIPVFNEEAGLLEGVHEVLAALEGIGQPSELVLVDDGSTDHTWSRIERFAASNGAVKGLRLSRNYGKESAIFAGLSRTIGQHVLVMDADLQHPPDAIAPMLDSYLKQGYDIIDGVKSNRGSESLWYRWCASAFNRLFSSLSGMNLSHASDFKIMSRRVVDSLLTLEERGVFFRGLTSWVGFAHGTYEFEVATRRQGQGSWSVSQLLQLGANAITSYTSSLLHLVSFLGVLFMLFAVVLGLQTLFNKLSGQATDGFTTVILLLLVIGAVIMVSLGIIGQYIARIYEEVKRRPRYIISDEI
ncbi:MAG: glycosyltransferase family 2 protein [Pseudomonadota bacterium]